MSSNKDPAKPAEPVPHLTHITGELGGPAGAIPETTSLASVGLTIPSCTLLEMQDSLSALDDELTNDDESSNSQVFSATLKNFVKNEEGGYLITFDVPECDRAAVAALVERGARVFSLVAISDNSSVPFRDE